MNTEERNRKTQEATEAEETTHEVSGGDKKAPGGKEESPMTETDEFTAPSMGELGADSGEIQIEPPEGQPEMPREVEGTTEHPG